MQIKTKRVSKSATDAHLYASGCHLGPAVLLNASPCFSTTQSKSIIADIHSLRTRHSVVVEYSPIFRVRECSTAEHCRFIMRGCSINQSLFNTSSIHKHSHEHTLSCCTWWRVARPHSLWIATSLLHSHKGISLVACIGGCGSIGRNCKLDIAILRCFKTTTATVHTWNIK